MVFYLCDSSGIFVVFNGGYDYVFVIVWQDEIFCYGYYGIVVEFFCRYDIWIVVIDGNLFNWYDLLLIYLCYQLFKILFYGVFLWIDYVEIGYFVFLFLFDFVIYVVFVILLYCINIQYNYSFLWL